MGEKYQIVYLVTKHGYVHLYDIESAKCLYTRRVSDETIFVTAPTKVQHGFMGINRKGQVVSIGVNEQTLVPYITSHLKDSELALRLAVSQHAA